MKIKLTKSTMLKVASGIVLVLTIAGTVIALTLAPPVAPIIAGIGTGMAIALAQEVVKAAFDRLCGREIKEQDDQDDQDDQDAHSEYVYKWSRTTHHLEKSDSGNHLDETTTKEEGHEDGANVQRPSKRPHP